MRPGAPVIPDASGHRRSTNVREIEGHVPLHHRRLQSIGCTSGIAELPGRQATRIGKLKTPSPKRDHSLHVSVVGNQSASCHGEAVAGCVRGGDPGGDPECKSRWRPADRQGQERHGLHAPVGDVVTYLGSEDYDPRDVRGLSRPNGPAPTPPTMAAPSCPAGPGTSFPTLRKWKGHAHRPPAWHMLDVAPSGASLQPHPPSSPSTARRS